MAISDNDQRIQGCGFAKLVGDNVDFVMKKYSIVMGRKSKNSTNDLVLGDLMSLSRQVSRKCIERATPTRLPPFLLYQFPSSTTHFILLLILYLSPPPLLTFIHTACTHILQFQIKYVSSLFSSLDLHYYPFPSLSLTPPPPPSPSSFSTSSSTDEFELEVLGKNGVSVNGTPYVPGDPPARLESKCLLQMGEVSLYFLLPRNPDDIFPPPPPPAAATAPIINVQPIAVPNVTVTSPQQQQQQQQQLQIDPAKLAQMLQQNPALMQTMAAAISQQQHQQK